MKRNQIIGAIAVLLIVAGGAFYTGDLYAKGQAPARGAGAFAAGGAAGFAARGGTGTRGAGAAGGFTAGQVVSTSDTSISIKMQNGSSTEIVLISPTTQILKSAVGTPSDLTVGSNVTVTGTTNSDGSLSASSIQLRPAGSAGGFPAGRPQGTPTQGQ